MLKYTAYIKNQLRSISIYVVVGLLGFLPLLLLIFQSCSTQRLPKNSMLSTSSQTFIDQFDSSHDFLLAGVAGTMWDGVLVNSGFDSTQDANLALANSNLTTSGGLTVSSMNGNWEGVRDDGFLLYKDVIGDFVVEVEVVSADQVDFHDMGLMARLSSIGDPLGTLGGDGEDYLIIRYFNSVLWDRFNGFRSTDNGDAQYFNSNSLFNRYLQMEKKGNQFFFRVRESVAGSWSELENSPVVRDDLAGVSLQVGIWQATFSSSVGTAQFDNFKLTVFDPN